jgi:branched-chain amino acid transport system substrate-binding protein
MKQKLLVALTAMALATFGTQVLAQAAKAKTGKLSGDMVKVGVMNDMVGLYADIGGPGSVEAAKMAVADFGGKIFGKPIEVVSADHQNKPDVGASKAREWFDTQGVDMIVDVPTSSVAIAVAKVANEKKRVFMNTGAATKALTNEECNPYTITPTTPTPWPTAPARPS